MQSPQSENHMSMRVCHIRHTLFLSFSMAAYFRLSAMLLPLAVKQHALQLLALAVASSPVLRVVTMRVYTEQLFFLSSFRSKFNIKRALSAHQSLTLLQKIDSREGLFRCKKG